VLLRRVAFKTFKKEDDTKTVWAATSENIKQQVKAALLEGYENEAAVAVRNKLCDTIADVARDGQEEDRMFLYVEGWLIQVEEWHELLNALFQSTKSPETAHRESAFRVFAALPTLVDISHADLLQSVFLAGLTDQKPQVPRFTIRD
jgi:importin-5